MRKSTGRANDGEKQRKAGHRHDWEKGKIGGMPYLKCKVKTCGKVSFPSRPARKTRGAFGGRLKTTRKPRVSKKSQYRSKGGDRKLRGFARPPVVATD